MLDDWIDANPYAETVNWSCTMEAALRILSWTWLFRVFHASRAWADAGFRERFLCALYLHGDFTERHLEHSDVNGNHCTADAAGLVFAGLFFGQGEDAGRWLARGWSLLCEELPRQVYPDGVDFEASVGLPPPGGRAVPAAGALPARLRARRAGWLPRAPGGDGALHARPTPGPTAARRSGATRTTRAPCRSAASRSPTTATSRASSARRSTSRSCATPRPAAAARPSGCSGPQLRRRCPTPRRRRGRRAPPRFPDGGFYVMRNDVDHVFVDCGRVGLAGRGGHGHNDCLSFEAALDGVHLVTDCGAFVYTALVRRAQPLPLDGVPQHPARRRRRRSTACEPDLLWDLEYDARPDVRAFETGAEQDRFVGAHAGYRRLAPPVTPVRTIVLDHREPCARWSRDAFEGSGRHRIEVPLHLAPGVEASDALGRASSSCAPGAAASRSSGSRCDAWALEIGAGRVSPSYGVALPIVRLLLTREGPLEPPLSVRIAPADALADHVPAEPRLEPRRIGPRTVPPARRGSAPARSVNGDRHRA